MKSFSFVSFHLQRVARRRFCRAWRGYLSLTEKFRDNEHHDVSIGGVEEIGMKEPLEGLVGSYVLEITRTLRKQRANETQQQQQQQQQQYKYELQYGFRSWSTEMETLYGGVSEKEIKKDA